MCPPDRPSENKYPPLWIGEHAPLKPLVPQAVNSEPGNRVEVNLKSQNLCLGWGLQGAIFLPPRAHLSFLMTCKGRPVILMVYQGENSYFYGGTSYPLGRRAMLINFRTCTTTLVPLHFRYLNYDPRAN